MGGWLQFGRGEVGWARRGRRRRNRVSTGWVYIDFYQWNHQQTLSVGIPVDESTSNCATSLYEYPSLNPSVVSNIVWKKIHVITPLQPSKKNYIIRRRYDRYIFCWYIPTVSPTDIFCRYISIKFEMELFLSTKITDEKILLVIPLVFVDFLVVTGWWASRWQGQKHYDKPVSCSTRPAWILHGLSNQWPCSG